MYQEDFLIRQIKFLFQAIASIFFNKGTLVYEIQDEANLSETDGLFLKIDEMLASGLINEAEDLLFENLKSDDSDYLLLAMDFYRKLNEKTDDELELYGFSREEIESGILEIIRMFGWDMPSSSLSN